METPSMSFLKVYVLLQNPSSHMSPTNKCSLRAFNCQREQSLRDNLIVLVSTSAVFDVSGRHAIEQTIIFLISLVLATYHACDIPLKLPDQTLHSI